MSYQIAAPDDVPEYAWPAWFSCLQWALGEDEIRAGFEKETGKRFSAPRCAFDILIADATGWREDYVRSFVDWFNANVWGKYSDEIE